METDKWLQITKRHVSDDPSDQREIAHKGKQAHERSCEKHGYCSTAAAIQKGECVTSALSDEEMARLGLNHCRCQSLR